MVLLDIDINFYLSDSVGSLGGNISSIKVTSNVLGNLYPDLPTDKAVEGVVNECRCIFLKNDSQTSKTGKITIWIENNAVSSVGNNVRVLFGLGSSGINAAEPVLPSPYMIPFGVDFIDISTKPTTPQIFQLLPQQRIPIWFNFKVGQEAKSENNVKFTLSVEVTRTAEDVTGARPTCPDGQAFDPSTGLCVDLPDPECPDNTTYDPITDQCIPDDDPNNPPPDPCPQGQHRNPSTGLCEPDVTNPPPTGQIKERIIGAVGDYDRNSASRRTFQALRSNMILQSNNSAGLPLSVWLPLGDYSYVDGDQSCFLEEAETLGEVFPTNSFPNIGNHDDTEDGAASDRTAIINAFGIPSEGYYAKTVENIRFIILDTQKSISATSPQVTFFRNELQAAKNNPLIKWVIVSYHKPSVTSTGNDHGQLVAAADSLHPIMMEFGNVDFVLAGHNHNTDITYMVKFNSGAPRVPVLANQGIRQTSGLHIYENVGTNKGVIFMVLGGGGRAADTTDMDDPWMAYAQNPYATGFFKLKDNGNTMEFKLIQTTDMSVKYLMEVRK